MISKEISFSELLKNNVIQKYSLTSLTSISDYVFCPHLPAHCSFNSYCNKFIYPKSECSNLLVCGKYPILTLYEPGSKNNNFNLRTIIANLANRISNTVTNVYFQLKKTWGFGFGGNSGNSSGYSSSNSNSASPNADDNIDYTLLLSSTTIASESIVSDPTRTIDTLICDPSLRYCISKDNFGRVLLIDINRNVILQIWKGYRNADFGWFQSPEIWEGQWDKSKDEPRDEPTNLGIGEWGTYLVIYAPLRQSIEIYRMNQCKRVYVEILNENDHYYIRTISNKGTLSNLLNIPTKCYLVKENKENMNEMKLIEMKLPCHSLDFIYMKKYSKTLSRDNYYMKILLKLLTNDEIEEKYINEVKKVVESNDLSQFKLQDPKLIMMYVLPPEEIKRIEKVILILKIVFLIQSSILLKHILKKIEKGGLYNLSENLIRNISDTIYQRVNIEINTIIISNDYKESENGIKELLLSSYENVRWNLKCRLHLLDLYDKINIKYYNNIINNELKLEDIFNEEYKDDSKIIEKIIKWKDVLSNIELIKNENWKLTVMKPVMFLCCLEASSSSSSLLESTINRETKERENEENEIIKYNFRSNNISESTSILFSSYLFQLLLLYPDKIEEIYRIQCELYLSNETMIILSYLWISSIPLTQMINFPFSIYNKWLNLFEKNFNNSSSSTLDVFIYDSIVSYIFKSNHLLNTLLYIDNIEKYLNSNKWNILLYKINTTLALSVVSGNKFTISDISSQNSIFDLINQLFYRFKKHYNLLQDVLMKLKNKLVNNNNNNIVYDINIPDNDSKEEYDPEKDITKIEFLFKILPVEYLNIDFLWFYYIYNLLKTYDFQNKMNEFDEIYNLINYIKNKQLKRTILYILWNDYLYQIMRSIVETKEEENSKETVNKTDNYLSNFDNSDNILRYKMIIIQYSISTLTDIKSTTGEEEKNEGKNNIIITDLFPTNNLFNLHLENIQNYINNYSKYNIFSNTSISIHLLYFRIIRLLLPSGDLFTNQWLELLDIFKCRNVLLTPNSLLKSVFIEEEENDNIKNLISSEDAINFLIKILEVHSDIAFDLGYLLNIDENQIKIETCRVYYLHNDDEEAEKIYNEVSNKSNINPSLFYLIRQRLSFYIYFLREIKMRELEMKVDMKILRWIRKAIPKDLTKIPSEPLPFTLNDVGRLIKLVKESDEHLNFDGISIEDLSKVCDSLCLI